MSVMCLYNDLANRALMLLVSYRLYLTQEFMTFLFKAANKSIICRNIQQMRPIIEAVLPTPERARQRIFSLAKAEYERRITFVTSRADAWQYVEKQVDYISGWRR